MYQIKPLYIIIFRLKKNVSGLGLMNSSFCVNCTWKIALCSLYTQQFHKRDERKHWRWFNAL